MEMDYFLSLMLVSEYVSNFSKVFLTSAVTINDRLIMWFPSIDDGLAMG